MSGPCRNHLWGCSKPDTPESKKFIIRIRCWWGSRPQRNSCPDNTASWDFWWQKLSIHSSNIPETGDHSSTCDECPFLSNWTCLWGISESVKAIFHNTPDTLTWSNWPGSGPWTGTCSLIALNEEIRWVSWAYRLCALTGTFSGGRVASSTKSFIEDKYLAGLEHVDLFVGIKRY